MSLSSDRSDPSTTIALTAERAQGTMANHLLFIVCSFLGVSKVHSETSKIDLYIGGFFGVNIKDGAWSSAALIPALEMALDHVNNDSTILTNYSLKYHWRDSKVWDKYILLDVLLFSIAEYFY